MLDEVVSRYKIILTPVINVKLKYETKYDRLLINSFRDTSKSPNLWYFEHLFMKINILFHLSFHKYLHNL